MLLKSISNPQVEHNVIILISITEVSLCRIKLKRKPLLPVLKQKTFLVKRRNDWIYGRHQRGLFSVGLIKKLLHTIAQFLFPRRIDNFKSSWDAEKELHFLYTNL